MSPDELIVSVVAVILGPVLWGAWLMRMARLGGIGRRRGPVGAIAAALALAAVLIFVVLKTGASFDVAQAPPYLFMYVVLGLAWLRIIEPAFSFAGLSLRDDLFERRNQAATPAAIGALLGVTLCYAGGNIGDGPGWWVVVFSAGLATLFLLAAWMTLAQLTPVADSVAIDRDPAAGVRLGAFLASSGLILGRAVAGDWISSVDTVADFSHFLPYLLAIVAAAILVERRAQPRPERPRAPLVASGILPALIYLLIAAAALTVMEWPA